MMISRTATAGIMLLLVLLLQGCGRKGPLFMPQVPAQAAPVIESQAATSAVLPNPVIQSQPQATKQP